MARTDFSEMHCSMARALEVLGEKWTPLILRDLLIGFTRFDEIREDLGIATNVLAKRLDKLVEHDVVDRLSVEGYSNRFDYRLTAKGYDTLGILVSLVAWGDRWEIGDSGPPTEFLHTTCGQFTVPVSACAECGQPLHPEDLTYHRGPGSRSELGTKLLANYLGNPRTRPAEE